MPAKRDTSRRLEYVPLDDLIPSERNPKRHNEQVIGNGIAKFGLVDLPVIDERTGRLVAGHGRRTDLLARRDRGQDAPDGIQVDGEGRWLVPTVRGWRSRSDHEAHAAGVTLNQATIAGGFDDADLAALINEIGTEDPLVEVMGFSDDELAALLAGDEPAAGGGFDGDPDEVPDDAPSFTAPGTVWTLGPHRLMCGNASQPADIERLMAGDLVDLLVTDPPYGVSYASKNDFLNAAGKGNSNQTPIENDHLTPDEVRGLWDATWTAVRPAMRPGACYYVTGPQGGDLLLLLLLLQSLSSGGFPLRHMLIWAKNNFVLGRSDYNYQHEPIIYGWVDGAGHKFHGPTNESSVWQIDKPFSSKLHPTMKPVAVWERAIKNSSAPGAVVLDVFAGSGTAVVAAHLTGRVARLMELDPHYCDVICRRFQEVSGEIPAREDGEPVDFIGRAVASAS